MVVARMIVQGVLVEVDFGVVSDSSSGGFVVVVVVVVVLKDFGLVLQSSWRMGLLCWSKKGDFLRHLSLMLVPGNMFVAVGACLFRIAI